MRHLVELGHRAIGISCLAAHVPQTTALRRLQMLEGEGLIERAGDPGDHRRTIIRLTAKGSAAMIRYFAGAPVGIALPA